MKFRKLTGLTLCCLLAVLSLTALDAQARTLEEILKEKGVITAEDYAEARKSSLVTYTPGKGMTASSSDGNSKLSIGGYAQLIYRFTQFDDNSKDNKSDFDIRRFKLQLKGNLLSKNFSYKFQGEMANGFKTEDAYLGYKFYPTLSLHAGQFKPPQARQELTSASKQLFPDRSLANDTFNLGRDQGIQLTGKFANQRVIGRIGLFNGNGPNVSNSDDNHMFAGRIDINPLGSYKRDEAGWTSDKPLLNLGGSFAIQKVGTNDFDTNGSKFDKDNDVMDKALDLDGLTAADFKTAYGNDLTWQLWTTNLNARWMGASFAAEYYNLNADPQLGADWDADGYYLQAGYQVIPKRLELAVRYSAVKSTDANASENYDKNQTQFGANYYFAEHLVKLQSDVTLVSDDTANGKDDTLFRLQAQFIF